MQRLEPSIRQKVLDLLNPMSLDLHFTVRRLDGGLWGSREGIEVRLLKPFVQLVLESVRVTLNLPHDSLATTVISILCVHWQLSLSSSHNVVPFFSSTGKIEFGFGSFGLGVLSGGGSGL